MPTMSPASAARNEASIARISRGSLISRSGQNSSPPRWSLIPRASSSMARPSGKVRGTSTRPSPRTFKAWAMTSAGDALSPSVSRGAASFDQERTRPTRACARARSISRSLITRILCLPFWMKRNGSGAKKPVGYRMSASVSEAA